MNALVWILWALGPFALFVAFVSSFFPSWVETVYARGLYPFLVKTFAWPVSWISIPFAEVLIVVVAIAFVALLVFGWTKGWLDALAIFAAAASIVVFWFVFGWGLNYNRQSWADNVGWKVGGVSVSRLEALALDLGHRASASRRLLPEDASGVAAPRGGHSWDSRELRERVRARYTAISRDWPLLLGDLPVVKTSSVGKWYSSVAVAGIFIPFTSEPIVNADPRNWTLAFAAAHESAHQRGWAREDEANFLAFFVLEGASDPELSYAATSSAMLYVASALQETEEGRAAWERVRAGLDPAIGRDWKASFAYWDAFRGPLADAGQAVNDAYLKSQGQKDGVRSYGRMVDLLVVWKDYLSATIAHPSM